MKESESVRNGEDLYKSASVFLANERIKAWIVLEPFDP